MGHIFIGRQPIIDGDGRLYGYELLHRGSGQDHAEICDGDRISSGMLLNAVLEIGIEQISGAHRAFINVTENLLMNPGLDTLPSERIVLEAEFLRRRGHAQVALVKVARTTRCTKSAVP